VLQLLLGVQAVMLLEGSHMCNVSLQSK